MEAFHNKNVFILITLNIALLLLVYNPSVLELSSPVFIVL